MRKALMIAAGVALAGCGVQAEPRYEAPWEDAAVNLKTHEVAAAFDEASLDKAVASYPGTKDDTDHYEVGVGKYLKWQIVSLFTSDMTVDSIRLDAFDEACTARSDEYGTTVYCALSAELVVEARGETHRIEYETESPVGAWMQPTEPYRPAVSAEVTAPVDEFVEHIGRELNAADVL